MKIIAYGIVIAIFVSLSIFFGRTIIAQTDQRQTTTTAPREEKQIPIHQPAMPNTLTIPKLQLTAAVESVGMDSEGRMDVPKDADNVGWYNLGNKPGDKGNAVMSGHFDKESGDPAVFFNLIKLKVDDKIIVTDKEGKEYTFSVVRKAEYPYNKFPLQEVFGSSDQPMLNLITCQGSWDTKTKNYSHRTVVYASLQK